MDGSLRAKPGAKFKEEVAAQHMQLKSVARKKHGELNDLIDHLSDKLSDVASNIDKEFLAAYKAHMSEVQAELKSLKQQVILAEAALNDDTSVAQLEGEVRWFSDEVTRLRTHTMSMKKDMNHIVSCCSVLNEQREFLNDQLKQVLKRSRVLEHEIGLANTYVTEAQHHRAMEGGGGGDDGGGSGGDPNEEEEYYGEGGDGDDGWGMGEGNDLMGYAPPPDDGRPGRTRRRQTQRDALLHNGGSSASPAKERAQAMYRGSSISQLDELFASRCPEEVIFERELEHIFKRMVARKTNETNRSSLSTARSNNPGEPPELQAEREEEELAHHARRMGGVTGLGLEHFSDTDRFTAICNFLDNQGVFEKVVQILAVQYTKVAEK